jgi:hypothetical protein
VGHQKNRQLIFWKELQTFAFAQMARRYYLEIALVESCDLPKVKPFGKRHYAGINRLESPYPTRRRAVLYRTGSRGCCPGGLVAIWVGQILVVVPTKIRWALYRTNQRRQMPRQPRIVFSPVRWAIYWRLVIHDWSLAT